MQPTQKVRVMVVDDSLVARNMIIRGLSAHPRDRKSVVEGKSV